MIDSQDGAEEFARHLFDDRRAGVQRRGVHEHEHLLG
jgi:hypothetical protein